MCPLRYIVFAVSALVALIVLVWGTSEEQDPLKELDEKLLTEEEKQEKAANKASIVDFFTGKYLYRKWNDYKASVAAST